MFLLPIFILFSMWLCRPNTSRTLSSFWSHQRTISCPTRRTQKVSHSSLKFLVIRSHLSAKIVRCSWGEHRILLLGDEWLNKLSQNLSTVARCCLFRCDLQVQAMTFRSHRQLWRTVRTSGRSLSSFAAKAPSRLTLEVSLRVQRFSSRFVFLWH